MGLEGDIEVSRRRSWAALEDLTHCKDTTKAGRQRRFVTYMYLHNHKVQNNPSRNQY